MSDWLEPLWNLFTPNGAQQKQQDNQQPSSASYSSFGRNNNTFKYKTKYPQVATKTSSSNVNEFQPKADGVGLQQIDEGSVLDGQTVGNDPRTMNKSTQARWHLSNMDIETTSPTNSSTAGYITAIGIFFVAMIVLKMVRR